MLERFLILGRRKIYSSSSLFCKSNGGIKYTDVETEKILSVVNNSNVEDLSRYAIVESRARKLYSVRERSGRNIESIDEITRIGGFGVQVLNKFCRSILNPSSEDEINKKSKERSYTYPPLPMNLLNYVKSFTSIHCGMTGVSWSTFEIIPNEMTKMTAWESRPLPESKLNLYHLAVYISSVLKDVPESDFYVFENPNVPNVGTSNKHGMMLQITQMVGMASVIAAERNALIFSPEDGFQPGTMNVAYLRKFLFARLFKLYVGTEQISTTDLVESLIRTSSISRVMDENIQTIVDVDFHLKSLYSAVGNSEKDFLGCSFLLGLAFLRLCLLKCPTSLKSIRR